jgi:hypothetical protein
MAPSIFDANDFKSPHIEMHTVLHMGMERPCAFCDDIIPARFPLLAGINGMGPIFATAHIQCAVQNNIATLDEVRRWFAAWRMMDAPPGWPGNLTR